jgi:hypothetical protein
MTIPKIQWELHNIFDNSERANEWLDKANWACYRVSESGNGRKIKFYCRLDKPCQFQLMMQYLPNSSQVQIFLNGIDHIHTPFSDHTGKILRAELEKILDDNPNMRPEDIRGILLSKKNIVASVQIQNFK